jgi:hypothetical protein
MQQGRKRAKRGWKRSKGTKEKDLTNQADWKERTDKGRYPTGAKLTANADETGDGAESGPWVTGRERDPNLLHTEACYRSSI